MQVYSARTALSGCKTLADMWSHQDTDELQRLKDQLTLLQDSGVVFPEESWPMRLLRSHPRYPCMTGLLIGRVRCRVTAGQAPDDLVDHCCCSIEPVCRSRMRHTG